MPINEKRESMKVILKNRPKTPSLNKPESPPNTTYDLTDLVTKLKVRGRSKNKKEVHTQPCQKEWVQCTEDPPKNGDSKRLPTNTKQSIKSECTKPPQIRTNHDSLLANKLRQQHGLKTPTDAMPVSLGLRSSYCPTGSQQSLELTFDTPLSNKEGTNRKDHPSLRPETAPSLISPRKKSPSPKVTATNLHPTSRPSTAPIIVRNRQPAAKEMPWKRRAFSPEVLRWIPKRTSSHDASGHVKFLYPGSISLRPPICDKSPVIAGPTIANRKRETRSPSATTRKTSTRLNDPPKSAPLSARPHEGYRNASSTLPIDIRRRCKSQMQRVNNSNMQNRTIVFRPGGMKSKSHPQNTFEPRGRHQSPITRATQAARRKANLLLMESFLKAFSPANRTNVSFLQKNENNRANEAKERTTASTKTDVSTFTSFDCSLVRTNEDARDYGVDKCYKVTQSNDSCIRAFKQFVSKNNSSLSFSRDRSFGDESRDIVVLKPYVNKLSMKLFESNKNKSVPIKVKASPIKESNPLLDNVQQRARSILLGKKSSVRSNAEKTEIEKRASKTNGSKEVAKNVDVGNNAIVDSLGNGQVTDVCVRKRLELNVPHVQQTSRSQSTELTVSTATDICNTQTIDDPIPQLRESVSTTQTTVPNKIPQHNKENLSQRFWSRYGAINSQCMESSISNTKEDTKINSCEIKPSLKTEGLVMNDNICKEDIAVIRNLLKKLRSSNIGINTPRKRKPESNGSYLVENTVTEPCIFVESASVQENEAKKTDDAEHVTDTDISTPPIPRSRISVHNLPDHSPKDCLESREKSEDVSRNYKSPLSEDSPQTKTPTIVSSQNISQTNVQNEKNVPPNVYVTYMSPVIVQSPLDASSIIQDIMESIENPKITTSKANVRSKITTASNTIIEGSGAYEKYELLSYEKDRSNLSKVLKKISALSDFVLQKNTNATRADSPTNSNDLSDITNFSPRYISKRNSLDSLKQFQCPSKMRIKECFWNALDRLVECQEEVINAFASFSDTYDSPKPERFHHPEDTTLKSCQGPISTASFRSSRSSLVGKRSKCLLSETADELSAGNGRTYCVGSLAYMSTKTSELHSLATARSISRQDTTAMISQITTNPVTDASMRLAMKNETAKTAQNIGGSCLTTSTLKTHTTKVTIPTHLAINRKSNVKTPKFTELSHSVGETDLVRNADLQKKHKVNKDGGRGKKLLSEGMSNKQLEISHNSAMVTSEEISRATARGAYNPLRENEDNSLSVREGVSDSELVYCPDARCGARVSPLTVAAHLRLGHPRVPSAVVAPGRAVCLALRPADLLPSAPCIAAFVHVVDRMQYGPFILMVAMSREAGGGAGASTAHELSSITSGLGGDTSVSSCSGFNLGPGPPSPPLPSASLFAWLVELESRSRCTVRVLRRCECARRVHAAASYTGSTVALRRSQRLADVVATGAYVVAQPQLLARLQQDGGEVEVSAMVLPGMFSESEYGLHHEAVSNTPDDIDGTDDAPSLRACFNIAGE